METLSLLVQLLITTLVDLVCGQKLMVILVDGFRWDYVDKYAPDFPGFQRLVDNGVKSDYLVPTFPSLTYPSLYTILTGLHPESHGMVGNNMWDEKEDETFDFGFNPEQIHPYWWNGGEPVWITATRQNKPTYVYEWPGCEVEIRGRRPTSCEVYAGYPTDFDAAKAKFVSQCRKGLEVLQNGSANLVLIYLELIDMFGHLYGPESTDVRDMVQWFDAQVDKLLDEISERGLDDDINLLILSDHGSTGISESRVIDISKVLHETDYDQIIDHGPITNIWPKKGFEKQVFDKLKSFSSHWTVYLKHKIPERWRRKNHFRVAPITCVAHTGWMIVKSDDGLPSLTGKTYVGYHGYDNNEVDMRGIFFAMGPNIRKGHKVEAFENVHVYQFMCRLLQIEPSPNNGSWSKVKDIYVETSYPVMITWWMTLFGVTFIAFILAIRCLHSTLRSNKSKEN